MHFPLTKKNERYDNVIEAHITKHDEHSVDRRGVQEALRVKWTGGLLQHQSTCPAIAVRTGTHEKLCFSAPAADVGNQDRNIHTRSFVIAVCFGRVWDVFCRHSNTSRWCSDVAPTWLLASGKANRFLGGASAEPTWDSMWERGRHLVLVDGVAGPPPDLSAPFYPTFWFVGLRRDDFAPITVHGRASSMWLNPCAIGRRPSGGHAGLCPTGLGESRVEVWYCLDGFWSLSYIYFHLFLLETGSFLHNQNPPLQFHYHYTVVVVVCLFLFFSLLSTAAACWGWSTSDPKYFLCSICQGD